MSTDSEPSIKISKERRITMPFAVLISIVMLGSAGAVGLNSTREQVARNTADIAQLRLEQAAMRELLIRIDENVKELKARRP